MSGLASFPPTCVGLPTYRSRLDLRVLRPPVPSVGADRPAVIRGGQAADLEGCGNWPQWRIDREIVFNTAPGGTEVFAAPVNTTGTAFESGVPQRLPFPPSMGVTAYSAVHSRRPALLDRSATGSTSGSNVNQRGAQLASVVEAVKATALDNRQGVSCRLCPLRMDLGTTAD